MTYWIGMASVLLLGYGLIKWSGRANEQANDGDSGVTIAISAGNVGTRSAATSAPDRQTSNHGTNQGYNGGEA